MQLPDQNTIENSMSEPEWVGDFEFDGTLSEYTLIALTNLLLTIVTLGIYRFWGTTRIRRYLWSRTIFMGERLEWSGTGQELLKGALIGFLVILLPIAIINFVVREMMIHDHRIAAGVLSSVEAVAFYGLIGAGTFRALRYRLSRTYWRGIRGGSGDPGLRYSFAYVWKYAIGLLTLGVLMPWAMVSLWQQRWTDMSFGSWTFAAQGRVRGLKLPFLICYLAPIFGFAAAWLLMKSGLTVTFFGITPTTVFGRIVIMLPAIFGFLFFFILIVMAYYASFFRQMVGATSLSTVEFQFNADAMEWMELYVGDIVLVVATLGLGLIFLNYRHWKFYLRYFQIEGQIDFGALTQSTITAPTQGEGLLDAFDMGAL
jgi:uncharacterized membrane protein YjgN (DUF898 family)